MDAKLRELRGPSHHKAKPVPQREPLECAEGWAATEQRLKDSGGWCPHSAQLVANGIKLEAAMEAADPATEPKLVETLSVAILRNLQNLGVFSVTTALDGSIAFPVAHDPHNPARWMTE